MSNEGSPLYPRFGTEGRQFAFLPPETARHPRRTRSEVDVPTGQVTTQRPPKITPSHPEPATSHRAQPDRPVRKCR